MRLKRLSRSTLAAVTAVISVSGIATARPADARFRGAPKPVCGTFWIFEVGYAGRVLGSKVKNITPGGGRGEPGDLGQAVGSRNSFTCDVGGMRNLNGRWAAGGTLVFGHRSDSGGQFGIKPRVRLWMNRKVSLDLSAGAYVMGSEEADYYTTHHDGEYTFVSADPAKAKYPAWLLETSLNVSDYAALTARYEIQRWEYAGTGHSVSVGAKLGSYAGLAGVGAVLVLAAIASGVHTGST
jgi:hypothetical protein